MRIFAIETSCDETAVAIVESKSAFEHHIIVNLLASQIQIHRKYGGVVPRLAARAHIKNLPILTKKAFRNQEKFFLDAIAYTDYPGLEPALLVGRIFAKTLGYGLSIPAYPVNHLYGHIFANFADAANGQRQTANDLFPAIGLVISGGHTQLYKFLSFQKIELLGKTVDDAVGEALDKGARILGLDYPGGPEIEKFAKDGREGMFIFPSPMIRSANLNFSFAGLKTALLYKVQELQKNEKFNEKTKTDLALAYQKAAFTVIVEKTKRALKSINARSLFVGGGVAANQTLKSLLELLCAKELRINFFIPNKEFCTDNAVMIALAHAIPVFTKK